MSLSRSVSRSGGFLPELAGELCRRIVQDGLEVTGPNVRVDLTRRDTCETVSSLDIPVSDRLQLVEGRRRFEMTHRESSA